MSSFRSPLRVLLLLAAASLVSAPILAQQHPAARKAAPARAVKGPTVEGITEYQLANGLRVLLFPDHSKPTVTVNMTVLRRLAARRLRRDRHGPPARAHASSRARRRIPTSRQELREHGAELQRHHLVDRTNYYETMPATDENLEFGIELEADRLVNSFISREDLVSEMTVVRNEFEQGEN